MRFSLIIATVDRVGDLDSLLATLEAQSFKDFEVIIVDQNAHDQLIPVTERYAGKLALRHLKSSVRNNSHARNLGLAIAVGEIMAFPDDDCLYPADVLERVHRSFETNRELDFLTGPALSLQGHLGPGRWHHASGLINMSTVWTSITEFNFFVRAAWSRKVGGFDEAFGLGARFGSAEGIDMVLRIMRAGGQGYYDYDLRILHPDKGLNPFTVSRAFQYGTGLGRALRKHHASARTVLTFLIRPIGGALINLLRLNRVAAAYHLQSLRGRLNGFFAPAADPPA